MSLFREILAEAFILMEDASVDAINNAISNMHPAHIVYNGPSGTGNGERVIYPVAYGISTAGNPVIRAFQPQGDTSSEVPAWKFFRRDRIKSWTTDNSQTFNPADLNGFNEDGDEQIETLYVISPISNSKSDVAPEKQGEPKEPEKVITAHPIRKSEVDNGGADKNTEKEYYTANDAVRDILKTSSPRISPELDKNIEKNVDKMAGQSDISKETIPAPDAIPITKAEIGGPTDSNEPSGERHDDLYANEGPVTKDDVNAEGNLNNQNTLAGSFRDMTDRMNGLYNDEEEENR